MTETLENSADSRETLRAALYQRLIDELGAKIPEYFRIPGIEDGVEKDGVEIYAQQRKEGTRVLIAIPICIREDATFRRVIHDGIRFMFCKAEINVNSLEDLEREWPKITEIIKYGENLLFYNPDIVSPYIFRPNQGKETTTGRPLSSKESIQQAAAIGLGIGDG